VRKTDNLLPSSGDVTESGSLNLPGASGPHRPVMGMLYLILHVDNIQIKLQYCGDTIFRKDFHE
jgi:hypothetical protein